jgi:tRNA-dihydrouridine synthase B
MLSHHGERIGVRHARKHLGWALDTAAATARASANSLKTQRGRVLTASDPRETSSRLAEAFDVLASEASASNGRGQKAAA